MHLSIMPLRMAIKGIIERYRADPVCMDTTQTAAVQRGWHHTHVEIGSVSRALDSHIEGFTQL